MEGVLCSKNVTPPTVSRMGHMTNPRKFQNFTPGCLAPADPRCVGVYIPYVMLLLMQHGKYNPGVGGGPWELEAGPSGPKNSAWKLAYKVLCRLRWLPWMWAKHPRR